MRIGRFEIKITYNKYGDAHWGYDYNSIYHFDHELSFYRLCICWTFQNGGEELN